jgi:hypothetical protein
MSIFIGIICGLAGLGLAVMMGIVLYRDKPGTVDQKNSVIGAQERKTA